MTFTSIHFFLFLSALLFLVAVFPVHFRWMVLLIASYYFYACLKIPYLLIVLVAVTFISYGCGILINKSQNNKYRIFWLSFGIIVNLSLLIWLKYVPFLVENINSIMIWVNPKFSLFSVRLLTAIGASYFVFQGISYLVDIYLEIIEPERHPGFFALSLGFFPKLLQGPIERSGNLLPQLRGLSVGSRENFRIGINLFLMGMFKKSVIADRLATLVDPVYNNVHSYYGLSFIVATYLFAFQLYFDFSGYTDMALGVGRFFNIRLTQNFNSPYLAISTADFWRRWHISFSSWILDYIFKPLQFRFRDWPRWGTPLALMLTFLVSGLWHGASWCFIVWGLIHGVYLGFSMLIRKSKREFWKILGLEKSRIFGLSQIVVTFHLVCFSWIFFRANNIGDAIYIVRSSVSELPRSFSQLGLSVDSFMEHVFLGVAPSAFLTVFVFTMLVAILGFIDNKTLAGEYNAGEHQWISNTPGLAQGCIYGVLCYLIAFNGVDAQGFIYLQF